MGVLRRLLAGFSILAALLSSPAAAQRSAANQPDPNALTDAVFSCAIGLWQCNTAYYDKTFLGTRTLRASQTVNTSVKNLVLIGIGQSQGQAVAPSAYVPTNASAIHNVNVSDGGIYNWQDPPLGSAFAYLSFGGTGTTCATIGACGSIWARIADIFISGGGTVPAATFNQVYLAPLNIGSTQSSQWVSGATYGNRVCAIMRQLAAKGITPGTTNVTFALYVMNGENDGSSGVTLSQYQANMNDILTTAQGCGFSGYAFLNKETWLCTGAGVNAVSTTIQNAQSGLWGTSSWKQGADADSLGTGNRRSDCSGFAGTHFNDTGMAALATASANAMHAAGAPF